MKAKIVKSLAAAVGIYTAAGFWGIPYLIKNVVPEKVSEATQGGNFSVESVRFNPYSFHLTLKNATFKTPQNGDLVSLKAFSLNLDPCAYLWRGALVVKEVALIGPDITVRRDEKGEFNFGWLAELGAGEEEEKKPSEPARVLIEHFSLKEGTLDYRDAAEGKSYALGVGPIGFNLDHIDLRDLSGANGKMRLYATVNDGGFIDLKGKIDALSPVVIGGSFAFDSGKLYTPWRYFKEKFPIEVADGKMQVSFDYRLNTGDINATELSGLMFDVSKLRVIPKGEARTLLGVETLHLHGGKVLPLRKDFRAESLQIAGVNVGASRSAEGAIDWVAYIDQIKAAFPEDENETKEPWNVRLERVALENVGGSWSDNAPKEPYRLSFSNGSVHTGVIGSDPKAVLNLSAAVDAIRLIRQRDGAAVAGMEALGIEGIEVDREGRFAQIAKVSLRAPSVALARLKDGSIDLSRYAYAPPSAPSTEEAASIPWGYRVGEIDLSGAEARFRDEVPSKAVAVALDQLRLNVRNVQSNPAAKSGFEVSARIDGKSTFAAGGDFIRSGLRSSGTFSLQGLNLALIDPYLEPATYASLKRGVVTVGGSYEYAPSKAVIKGKVSLSDWVVNDTRDDSVLLGWENIGATPFVYAYPDNRLKINQLAVEGLYTNALIDEKKVLNYSTLSRAPKGDANATTAAPAKGRSNPFGIDIVKLLVHDSSATFSDQSLPLPFKTYIHDLEGSVLGISTTKDVTTFVKLRGEVDQYGLAKIDGSLNTKDPKQFTDIRVAFDNLDLGHYTPYSLQFLGYKIDGGKLFLNLGYKINGGKLNAANQVVIKQIELGAEKEGGSPWPMRLVVALLEDTNGVIDIDLPIEGDVNNPDFKYGKVVWQVIGNILTKAVTAPFRFLGSLLGIESEKLSSIDFEGGSAVLQPPQIEKLDQITRMLQKRPKISIEVYGSWEEESDAYVLKGRKLVALALKRDKKLKIDSPHAIAVDLLEDMADDIIGKKERKAIENRLEKQYKEEAEFVRHYSAELIEKLIVTQTVSPQELESLASRRSDAIAAYLFKTPGLETRIILKPSEAAKPLESKEIPVRLNVVVQK